MRSAPATSVRCLAIHAVVMSAATVMRRTATSYGKSGAMRSSVARSAGSASLPVTNRVLRHAGPVRGAADASVRRAGQGSRPSPTCWACPPCGNPRRGFHSTVSSIRLARAKSRSVTPLLEWVRSFTHTLPHVTSRSG